MNFVSHPMESYTAVKMSELEEESSADKSSSSPIFVQPKNKEWFIKMDICNK